MAIGHERVGSGQRGVIVLNDWLSDTSSWEGARPYLIPISTVHDLAHAPGLLEHQEHAGIGQGCAERGGVEPAHQFGELHAGQRP